MHAILERIGGRIFGCLLLSTLPFAIGLVACAPYPPVPPVPGPCTLCGSVSDGSASEYARGTGEDGLEGVPNGENEPASLGFGVARPDVILEFSSSSWGSGGERIEWIRIGVEIVTVGSWTDPGDKC